MKEELSKMKNKKVKFLDKDFFPSPHHERIICCHILKDMDEETKGLVYESCSDEEDAEDTLTPFQFCREEVEQYQMSTGRKIPNQGRLAPNYGKEPTRKGRPPIKLDSIPQ